MIRLFVGLGNPGPEYEDTRHNAGFWWVDQLARQWRTSLSPDKAYHGLVARVNHPQGPAWLLQPMTYMNLSGKSVGALARFFKIAPEEILVVHDELDLQPGEVKIKKGGGAAGHNGLKDITAQLGSPDYWRLRLGIGHPGVRAEVAAFVLRKPPIGERDLVDAQILRTLDAVPAMLDGDMEKAQRLIHAKPSRPKADKAADKAAAQATGTPAGPAAGKPAGA